MPNTMVGMMADDLLETIVHSYVDVGTISSLLARGSEKRRFLFVQNDGNKDVYIMYGRPASIHQGICLQSKSSAMFTACNSSLCSMDLFAITNSTTPVRVLISEGF